MIPRAAGSGETPPKGTRPPRRTLPPREGRPPPHRPHRAPRPRVARRARISARVLEAAAGGNTRPRRSRAAALEALEAGGVDGDGDGDGRAIPTSAPRFPSASASTRTSPRRARSTTSGSWCEKRQRGGVQRRQRRTAYSRLGRHVRDWERARSTAPSGTALERRAQGAHAGDVGVGGVLGDVGARQDGKKPGRRVLGRPRGQAVHGGGRARAAGRGECVVGLAALEHRRPPRLRDALEAAAVKHCRFASKEGGRDVKRGPVRAPPRRDDRRRPNEGQSPGFKPYELTMMFWALTRLGDEPGMELRGLFEAQCGRQLHLLKPQELSMVASAYGRVERVAPLLAAVAEESVMRAGLNNFKPNEIANLMWGLAKVHARQLSDGVKLRRP